MNKISSVLYKPIQEYGSAILDSSKDLIKDEANDYWDIENVVFEQGNLKPQNKYIDNTWMVTALGGGLSFAIANFLLGKTSELGVHSLLQSMIGNFMFSFIFLVVYMNKTRGNKEASFLPGGETIVDNIFNYFGRLSSKTYTLMILLDSLITLISGIFVVYTFKYCIYTDMNQGVITSLFAFSSVFLSIIAYVIFGEKISNYQMVGMGMMITGTIVLLTPQNSANIDRSISSEYPQVMAFAPVILAILTSLGFGLRTLLLKFNATKLGYDPVEFTSHSYIISGFVVMVYLLGMNFFSGKQHINNTLIYANNLSGIEVLLTNIISGGFSGLANILVNHATSTGPLGAASSLTNIQPVAQTILNSFLLYQFPNILQITGLFIGVVGSILLSSR